MSNFIRVLFKKHPLLTNCLTYGSLCTIAELSQQFLIKKVWASPKETIDFPAVGRFAFVGTFVNSPILHAWYKWLDGRLSGTTWPIVMKKLAMDQLCFTPLLLCIFYTIMSILERKDPFLEIRHKFIPTYQRSCMFWLPASTINFLFVAPQFRVIYIGGCSLIWLNLLAWIKRQKTEEISKNQSK